jgi:hypothetical protein
MRSEKMTEFPGVCNPDIVCVLGMHRSGTSLLARVLNLIGVYLGPDEVLLLEGGEANPKGYWEHGQIVDLNDAILATHGGRWDEVPKFVPGWEACPMLDELKQRARTLIDETFGNSAMWGWKDPRNCITVPFWQQLLPEMRYIVCLRNPVDVAHSLAHRDGLSEEKSASLWLSYVNSALEHTEGQRRLIVFYEDLMDNWPRELQRLTAFLGVPERAEQVEVKDGVRAFVEKELQHYRSAVVCTTTNQPIAHRARALFRAQRLSVNFGRRETDAQDEMDEQIENALNLLSVQSNTLRVLEERLAEREETVETLSARLDQTEQTGKELARQLAERDVTVQSLEAQATEREENIRVMAAQLLETGTQLKRIMNTLGWRLLNRFGPIKYRYLVPLLRLFDPTRAEPLKTPPPKDNSQSRGPS